MGQISFSDAEYSGKCNWFALSDPAMEEALYEIASLRAFAHLSLSEPIPDETTIQDAGGKR